jgi:hypothetical protein
VLRCKIVLLYAAQNSIMRGFFLLFLFLSAAYSAPWCNSPECGIPQGCRFVVNVTDANATNATIRLANRPLNLSAVGCGSTNPDSLRAMFVNGSQQLPVPVGYNTESKNTSIFFFSGYGAGEYLIYFGSGSFAKADKHLSGFLTSNSVVLTCTATNPAIDPVSHLECPKPQHIGPTSSDFRAHVELWSDAAPFTSCGSGGWPIGGGVMTGNNCVLQCSAAAGPMHKICERDCYGSFTNESGYAKVYAYANAQGSCQARVSTSLYWYVYNSTVKNYAVEFAPSIEASIPKYQPTGPPVLVLLRNTGGVIAENIFVITSRGGDPTILTLMPNQSEALLVNMSPLGFYTVDVTVSYYNHTQNNTFDVVLYNSTVQILSEQSIVENNTLYKTISFRQELAFFNNRNGTYNLTGINPNKNTSNLTCFDADGNSLNTTSSASFDGGEIMPNTTRHFVCFYQVMSQETHVLPAPPTPPTPTGGGGGGGGGAFFARTTPPAPAKKQLNITILSPTELINQSLVYISISASEQLTSCTAEMNDIAAAMHVKNNTAEKTFLGIAGGRHTLTVACFTDGANASVEKGFVIELSRAQNGSQQQNVVEGPTPAPPNKSANKTEITGAYFDLSGVLPGVAVIVAVAAYVVYHRRLRISPSRARRALEQRRREN